MSPRLNRLLFRLLRPRFALIPCLAWLLLFFSTGCGHRATSTPNLDLGIWYWHSPFKISMAEEAELIEMGIKTVYVRAGTFALEDRLPRMTLRQTFDSAPDVLDVVLVFNFTLDLARSLDRLDPVEAAHHVAIDIQERMGSARLAGNQISGIQIDADCPARLLRTYSKLLIELRKQLPPGTILSATGLPTWLTSEDLDKLTAAVDFLVPQFYENRPVPSLDQMRPVSDFDELASGLARIAKRQGVFRIGVPSYGHAMIFDRAGKASGMYRSLSLSDAMRHPNLKFVAAHHVENDGVPANEVNGEIVAQFQAAGPSLSGRGDGYRLAYSLPTPKVLYRHLEAIRRAGLSNMRGAIIFRFPEPGEDSTLRLAGIRAGLADGQAYPVLKAELQTSRTEFGHVQARVVVENTGAAATFPHPESMVVELRLPNPGVEEVGLGEFVRIQSFRADSLERAPLARSEVLRLSLPYLPPGGSASSGFIVLPPGTDERKIVLRCMAMVSPTRTESISGSVVQKP